MNKFIDFKNFLKKSNILLFDGEYRIAHYNYLQIKCIPYYVISLDNEDTKYYLDDIVAFIDEPPTSKKKICGKCIEDPKNYKKKEVIQVLIEWIEFLKLRRNVQEIQSTITKFYVIFSDPCKKNKIVKRGKNAVVNDSNINIPFTNHDNSTNFSFETNNSTNFAFDTNNSFSGVFVFSSSTNTNLPDLNQGDLKEKDI